MTIFVKGLPDEFINDLAEQFGGVSRVEGVFLAGSSAHDELLWCSNPDQQLLSDVEVGVVCTSLAVRKEIRGRAAKLSEKYQCEVEPFLITPRRLTQGSPKNLSFRQHSPNLLMFDVINGARWIKGAPQDFRLASFDSAQLPAWEGIRLILNRIGEGCEVLIPWFSGQAVDDEPELNRWLIKLLLAAGDACLIVQGKYISGYGHRQEIWQNSMQESRSDSLFHTCINQAYQVRAGENYSFTETNPKEILEGILAVLQEMLSQHLGRPIATQLIFEDWGKMFRGHPIAVRYQAPFAMLDAQFDTLLSIPQLIGSGLSWRLVYTGGLANLPVQLLVYGIIYCGVNHFSQTGSWTHLDDLLDHYAGQSNEKVSTRTKALWNVFCK